MASVIENYFKFEVCTVVRLLQAEGVSQSEIHRWLVSLWPERFQPKGSVCVMQQI
jgi:hypothetical protein